MICCKCYTCLHPLHPCAANCRKEKYDHTGNPRLKKKVE